MRVKDVIVDVYYIDQFKKLFRRGKEPNVVPFFVFITTKEKIYMTDEQRYFLAYYYKQETDTYYSSNVAHIRRTNPIKDWGHFIFIDPDNHRRKYKYKILDCNMQKENDFVQCKYLLEDPKGIRKYYTTMEILKKFGINKILNMMKKIDAKEKKHNIEINNT